MAGAASPRQPANQRIQVQAVLAVPYIRVHQMAVVQMLEGTQWVWWPRCCTYPGRAAMMAIPQ
jgi:hypothetical protein